VRIDIEDLGMRYGRHVALAGVSLSAMPGEILGVLGPNGSGKSSLVKAMAGILPYAGVVRFDGSAQRPSVIGYMPQDHQSRAALTVLETVLLGRLGRLRLRVTDEDLAAAERVLSEIGIAHLVMRDLEALSGGQRQLVFLAQALASAPRVLLLDEPFSALDIRHQLEVAELLARLTREKGLTTILVLHDLPMAARLADRIALLQNGRLTALGSSADVLASPAMRAVFHVEFVAERLEGDRVEIRRMQLIARE
jgi:iron complex transport system ATP-binding protein